MAPKVLVILTSHSHIPSTTYKTGWYLPEFSHVYDVLTSSGISITTASPSGGIAPISQGSVELFASDASAQAFISNPSTRALFEQTLPLSSFLTDGAIDEFAAVYFPGGHGPMFDLATDSASIAIVEAFAAKGKVVAAVCHGPAALVNARNGNGNGNRPLLEGKEVTGLSNAEEEASGTTEIMPFSLEDKMVEAGGRFKKAGEIGGECVVVADGGRLITGQNPASARGVGEAIVKAIGA